MSFKLRFLIALIALIGYPAQLFASEPLEVDKLIFKTTDLNTSNALRDMNGNDKAEYFDLKGNELTRLPSKNETFILVAEGKAERFL